MLEIVASLWIGIMVVVSVMAGVIKADEYFYKRKRVRELDTQHKLFMAQRRSYQEYTNAMMRTSMNPVFAHTAMCTASRSSILTDLPRPEPMAIPTDIPEWDGVAVEARGPFRSLNEIYQEQNEANNAAMDRMAENVQTQLDDMMRDHMTAIPAPKLFKRSPILIQPIDPKLFIKEEVCDDRETDDQSN